MGTKSVGEQMEPRVCGLGSPWEATMRRNIVCSSKTPGAGRITSIWVLLGALRLGALNGYGQGGRASINGTVMDQSGSVVPEAKIVVTYTTTGQVREAASTENGTYVIPLLAVGTVSVTCSRI